MFLQDYFNHKATDLDHHLTAGVKETMHCNTPVTLIYEREQIFLETGLSLSHLVVLLKMTLMIKMP